MVARMKPGSVVVDLAAESGGNVEGSVAGQDVAVPVAGGQVVLVGMKDAASTMPADASRLYAKNVANLLLLMTKDGEVVPDFDDEVVAGTCLTHDGAVRHAPTAALLGDAPAAPVAEPAPPPAAAPPRADPVVDPGAVFTEAAAVTQDLPAVTEGGA
jgi:NAD(P) transhydrogenase subunit alpha